MTAIRLHGPGPAGAFFSLRAPRAGRALAAGAAPIIRRMSNAYLWVKAFHIVFVASWFAALFYLPRIFVNLAQVPADSHAERERLVVMGRRLYRFGSGLMVVAIGLGLALWLGWGVGMGSGWMHAKLALVVAAIGYHHLCRRHLERFALLQPHRSQRWYRVFNESAVLIFTAAVVLVVVKPF